MLFGELFVLIELIWLWGNCSKIFQKYLANSDKSARKKFIHIIIICKMNSEDVMCRCGFF